MKYWVIPQLYTIVAFAASIYLWGPLSKIPIVSSMEGIPLYSIDPLFALELLLSLSTVIVWSVAFLFSLYNLHKEAIALTKIVRRNSPAVLAIFTVIVALSGCVVYSQEVPYFEEFYADELRDLRGLREPNPFALLHGYGILICEALWIFTILAEYLSARFFRETVAEKYGHV